MRLSTLTKLLLAPEKETREAQREETESGTEVEKKREVGGYNLITSRESGGHAEGEGAALCQSVSVDEFYTSDCKSEDGNLTQD